MKELVTQIIDNQLVPNTPHDAQILSENYQKYQLVRIKTYTVGAMKERSVTALGLLYACMKLTSENTDNPAFSTPDKVKFAIKVVLDFRDPNACWVRPDGTVQFLYRSFSFATLGHMESINLFERAFDLMGKWLGVSKEELILNAQAIMVKRHF